MIEHRSPKFFYGYIIVLAAFCAMMLSWGASRSFGVFLEPIIDEFSWTRAATSGAFTVCMIILGLLGIIAGRLNDRFGPRLLLTACGFFLGLGYLLMSRITTIWQLYLVYGVVIAIGMSGAAVPMMSTVARWFTKRRGLMTGILIAGPGFGIAIVPLVASWLISSYGWRPSYTVIGIVVLVLIISAAQFLRRDPSQVGQLPYGEDVVEAESSTVKATGFFLREAIRTGQFWILGLLSFGNFFNINVAMVHIVIHATGLGISPTLAASVLSVTAGVSIAGRVIMGSVADKIGNKPTVILGFSLTLFAYLWLLVAEELWMLYLFAIIFGLGAWALGSVTSLLVAELFGMRSHGLILGVIVFVGNMGGALGPVLAGHIFDVTSSYQLAFLICAIIGVAIIILSMLLRPTGQRGGTNDS